jgi:hypothetical protein
MHSISTALGQMSHHMLGLPEGGMFMGVVGNEEAEESWVWYQYSWYSWLGCFLAMMGQDFWNFDLSITVGVGRT